MRFFADNTDYRRAVKNRSSAAAPITYRMLHEDAAGMGLCAEFFAVSGIDPEAPVKCNCAFDEGHEAHCDLVAANELLRRLRS